MAKKNSRDPGSVTDEVIARNFARYAAIRREDGFIAARKAAVDDLAGVIMWLHTAAGPRATYNLVQNIADDLVQDNVRVTA